MSKDLQTSFKWFMAVQRRHYNRGYFSEPEQQINLGRQQSWGDVFRKHHCASSSGKLDTLGVRVQTRKFNLNFALTRGSTIYKSVTSLGLGFLICEVESASCLVMSNSLDPIDCNPPGSSVHGILQEILEWVTIPFSRRLSQPGSPALAGGFFTV